MKKANITIPQMGNFKEWALVENATDLMEIHADIFGSEFDNYLKEKILSFVSPSDITGAVRNLIMKSNISPMTKVCLANQIEAILEGSYLAVNRLGGYFPFNPKKATIVRL